MISDLPHELESEILARVPLKSLANLKTTCKRWYVLFKDPEFVKKKNNLCNAGKEVMLLINGRVYSINVKRDHNSIDASMEFTGKLSCLEDSQDVVLSKIYHCKGLILSRKKDSLVVWNPCTHETRSIKPKKNFQKSDNYSYVFGCGNRSCHDYKILRCIPYNKGLGDFLNYEMYEFRSDSWRALDGLFDKWRSCPDGAVSLKGNAYWIHKDRRTGHNVLLSFNFTMEVFASFPCPDQSDGYDRDNLVISVVREEHFALSHHIDVGTYLTEINVWLSNKIDEGKDVSWSKFLVVSFDKSRLAPFSLLTSWVDEDNKLVVTNFGDRQGVVPVYIVGEGFHKLVYEDVNRPWWLPIWGRACLLSYVPNFGHIPKAKTRRNIAKDI